jgi:hypothetical protein
MKIRGLKHSSAVQHCELLCNAVGIYCMDGTATATPGVRCCAIHQPLRPHEPPFKWPVAQQVTIMGDYTLLPYTVAGSAGSAALNGFC